MHPVLPHRVRQCFWTLLWLTIAPIPHPEKWVTDVGLVFLCQYHTDRGKTTRQLDRHPDAPLAGEVLSMCFSLWVCMRAQNPTSTSYDSQEVLLPGCCSISSLLLFLFGLALTWAIRQLSFIWCAITHIYIEIYTHNVGVNKTDYMINKIFKNILFFFLIGIFSL